RRARLEYCSARTLSPQVVCGIRGQGVVVRLRHRWIRARHHRARGVHRRGSQELTLQELGRKMARKAPIDQDLIRELASLLDETGLSQIEIEPEGLRRPVPPPTTALQPTLPHP